MDNKIIICFSTIPSRIKDLEPVIQSLLNQTLRPDKIYINVPIKYKRFSEKFIEPEYLRKYEKVKVFYLDEDYGPGTKFIGALLNKEISENDYVFITDDDVKKRKYWLNILFKKFISLKKTTICSYVELNLGKKIIWGYMGFVFTKSMFDTNDLLLFFENVSDECFLVDDHWLTGYCHYRMIPIYNIPIKRQFLVNIPIQGNDSLVSISGDGNRRKVSEDCRKCIKDKYDQDFPFWCCIGCCKRGKRIVENFEPNDIKEWIDYKFKFAEDKIENFKPDDTNDYFNKFNKYTKNESNAKHSNESADDKVPVLQSKTESKKIEEKELKMRDILILLILSLLLVRYIVSLDNKFNLGILKFTFNLILPLLNRVQQILNNFNSSISVPSKGVLIPLEEKSESFIIGTNFILIGSVVFILINSSKLINNITKIVSPIKNIENFEVEIPKLVIQTYYKKEKIPQKVYENIKEFAPEYKHIIFDDEEIKNFLKKNYKSDVLSTFNSLKGAHKADLFRYCFLYKFGGIYLDIKTELIKPLNEIFNRNYTYSVISIVRDTVYQGVIATPPGNPLFLKLIKFMIQIVKTGRKYNYIIFTKDFWNNVYRECNMRPFAGVNKNIENPKYNYLLFQEKCTKDKLDCYDGLDRHKLCCYICEGGERIIKSRYADFPW